MKPWFRHRGPTEGQGYSVASWQGAVAAIIFVIIEMSTAGGTVLAARAGVSVGVAVPVGMAAFVVVLIAFIALIKRTSDWKG